MSWVHAAVPLAATVGILVLLGMPIALAFRARGYGFVTLTATAAFAVLAISPIITGFAGIRWSILVPLAMTVLVSLVVLFFWKVTGPKHSRRGLDGQTLQSGRMWWPLAGAALGGLIILSTFVRRMWGPDSVSQTYDANFHLNLVARMLESGNPSPLSVDLSSPGNPTFYPAAWHSTVALIAQVSGASVPLATNVLLLVCVSVVWPIGVVTLARVVFGPSIRVSLVAGLVAASIPAVPYTLGAYGILYPLLLASSLTPFALVAALKLLRLSRAKHTDPIRSTTAWVYLLGTLGAIGLSQPSGVHAFILLITPAVIARFTISWKNSTTAQRTTSIMLLLGFAAIAVGLWYVSGTSDNEWETRQGFFSAIWEALSSAPRLHSNSWILLTLALIGSALLFWIKRNRWLTASWLLAVLFFAIADGYPDETLRTALTGLWYNDSWRLAAIVMTAIIPLVVYGVLAILSMLRFALRHSTLTQLTRKQRPVTATLLLVFLFVLLQSPGMATVAGYIETKYEPRPEKARLLDEDERTLLERLPEEVPEDAVIINNPWNGGALAEAISDREVLVPHTGGSYPEESFALIEGIATGEHLACDLAHELDAQYVLDFGTKFVFGDTPRAIPFENITDIDPSEAPAVTEIDREGDAVLYQVTGCG